MIVDEQQAVDNGAVRVDGTGASKAGSNVPDLAVGKRKKGKLCNQTARRRVHMGVDVREWFRRLMLK